MKYQVHWSDDALAELDSITAHIAQFDPAAAMGILSELLTSAQSLEIFPRRGRPIGRGFRQMSAVYPYIIRHCIEGSRVEITRVFHGARNVRSKRLAWSPEPPLTEAL